MYWYYEWGHSGGEALPSLTVEPGAEKEYYIEVDFPRYIAEYIELRAFFNLRYKIDPDASYKASQKGFLVKGIQTKSTLKLNSPYSVQPGGSLDYSIQSAFTSAPIQGNTTIKLVLEKINENTLQFEEIKTLLQAEHDFSINGNFQHNEVYQPGEIHPYGSYRLKLEVEGSI